MTKEEVLEARIKICASIKALRKKRGLTLLETANLLEIKEPTVSKIENGKWSVSLDMLIKLSEKLKFEINLTDINNEDKEG
jgi:transcriptional regulator with XRE-family HTH domain